MAGVLWIGISRREIPLALFFDRRGCGLDLAVGIGSGLLLVGLWRLASRYLVTARQLEEALGRVLGPLPTSEVIALALLSGFAEELFFRGAVQGTLGLLPATLIFALLHSGSGRAFRLWTVFAGLAGLLFGLLMAWRGNLLGPMLGHFLVNAINLKSLSGRFGESVRLADDREES